MLTLLNLSSFKLGRLILRDIVSTRLDRILMAVDGKQHERHIKGDFALSQRRKKIKQDKHHSEITENNRNVTPIGQGGFAFFHRNPYCNFQDITLND